MNSKKSDKKITSLRLNLFSVQEHFDSKTALLFAHFLVTKSKYITKGSVMQGYNNSKAEREWEYSRIQCKSYRNKWLELGWCETQNNNADLFFHHPKNCRSDHYVTNKSKWTKALEFTQFGLNDDFGFLFRESKKKKYDKKKLVKTIEGTEHSAIKNYTITIKLKENAVDILEQLRLLLLQWTKEKAEWIKKRQNHGLNSGEVKSEDIPYFNTKEEEDEYNVAQKKRTNYTPSTEHPIFEDYKDCHFILSLRKIAKIFNCGLTMAWKHICRMAKKGLIKVFKDEIAFSKDTTPRISWRDDAPDVVYGKPSATNFVNYGQYCYCNTYSFGV